MVLGFGSKSKKKTGALADANSTLRARPSLPEMSTQGIPWPENLVDVAAIRSTALPADGSVASGGPLQAGAVKLRLSFSSPERTPSGAIPFHRPFRVSNPDTSSSTNGNPSGNASGNGIKAPIASLYTSFPPSAFSSHARSGTYPPLSAQSNKHRTAQRKARIAPAFNLMVAGAQGIGKSSLLRLLIDTADISPTASSDQLAAMDAFLRSSSERTTKIDTACVEICESKWDRVLLSVIDTPGLDFQDGHELRLERQVSTIVKYLDLQFADTMDEEARIVRKSKSDQHVHLCLYLIDPDTVMTLADRRALSSLPSKSASQITVSVRKSITNSPDTEEPEEGDFENNRLTMSPADLRVIKRLAKRVNVLPVIARGDSLTDGKLALVKDAIRRDLNKAGLAFGLFLPPSPLSEDEGQKTPTKPKTAAENNGNGNGVHTDATASSEEEKDEDSERTSRPVVKLRSGRHQSGERRSRSRSRSRMTIYEAEKDDHDPLPPDATDPESVASVRFSARAHNISLPDLLPFVLIMPEQTPRRRRLKPAVSPRTPSHYSTETTMTGPASPTAENGESEAHSVAPTLASTKKISPLPFADFVPRDLRGVFVRRFRWGTVDVLDPAHCDFAALRTTILSTHLKVLKTHTKEVLYEKYRTEKLLARRATRNFNEDDRKRLLEDLGI